MLIIAFSISGVFGVLFPVREVVEDVVGTAREQLREILLFLPDIVDLESINSKYKCKQKVSIVFGAAIKCNSKEKAKLLAKSWD